MRHLLFILFLSGALQAQTEQPTLQLSVSENLASVFPDLAAASFTAEALPVLFKTLSQKSDDFCSMRSGRSPWNQKKAAGFIAENSIRTFRSSCEMCLHAMIAGCWNFFKMNDRFPERDFQLVHHLYQRPHYNCYSVGFLQPYIMHNALNCRSLTMLDIDWKILHGHQQFMALIRENSFPDVKALRRNIGKLRVGWVAHHREIFGPNVPANFNILCKKDQRAACENHVLEFQKKADSVREVKLNLSGLHDGDYRNSDGEVRVIYLSNAIENIYTKPEEFDHLLRNLFVTLKSGEKAVLIHHVGGYSQFGLYEFSRGAADYSLKTICKDPYKSTAVGSTTPFYDSYFEGVSANNGKAPTCGNLLAGMSESTVKEKKTPDADESQPGKKPAEIKP